MKATIHPSILKGRLRAPASKSSMQRALAAALVRDGETVIHNPGESNDDKAAMQIIRDLGAGAEMEKGDLHVISKGIRPLKKEINCDESGLSMRMFTPLVAVSDSEVIINGRGSLKDRPMDFFDEVLPKLGVKIRSTAGKLPFTIQGPLKPANITVDGSLSSQFLTGLLFAYAAAGASGVSIKVTGLSSKPYIDLTLDVMKSFGLKIPSNKNYEEFYFAPADIVHLPSSGRIEYTVESDWSSASFLLVAGAIAGPVMISGLDLNSSQADRKIMDALMFANANIAMEAKGIKTGKGEMNAFEFDATDCPDLFPPLVALASYCRGNSRIRGVHRLQHKESNRAHSLKLEFEKMGTRISWEDDMMEIRGGGELKGAVVHSHHDHRIAMALAIAGLAAKGITTVEKAEAVNKSYPGFFSDLKKLGADVSLDNKIKLHE